MKTTSDEAIILEVRDLHEKDRIVTFLTRGHGLKRGVARSAKRRYSRFAGQLQPLARVRVTWFEKDGRDLVRVRDVDLERPAERLHADLEGILVGSFLADQARAFVQENEESELAFRLLDSTVEALMEGVDRHLAGRYFEMWILRLAGIFLPPIECPHCGTSLVHVGGTLPSDEEAVVCSDCARPGDGLSVPPEVVRFFVRAGTERVSELGELEALEGGDATLDRAEEVCARVRRRFLGYELKSYGVMKRTLAV